LAIIHRILLSSILSVISFTGIAQLDPVYSSLTTKDGLPSNEVYFTNQDINGIMWIGTDRGLVRYDGYNMKTLSTQDGLPGNTVLRSYLDYKGRLWCSTYKGGIFYIENDSVKVPRFNHILVDYSHRFERKLIKSIYVDRNDSIHLFFNKRSFGFLKTEINSESIIPIVIKSPNDDKTYVKSIILDKSIFENIILGRNEKKQLEFFQSHFKIKKTSSSYAHATLNQYYTRYKINSFEFENKRFYSLGNSIFDQSTNRKTETYSSPINQVYRKDSILFVCLQAGLKIYLDSIGSKNIQSVAKVQ